MTGRADSADIGRSPGRFRASRTLLQGLWAAGYQSLAFPPWNWHRAWCRTGVTVAGPGAFNKGASASGRRRRPLERGRAWLKSGTIAPGAQQPTTRTEAIFHHWGHIQQRSQFSTGGPNLAGRRRGGRAAASRRHLFGRRDSAHLLSILRPDYHLRRPLRSSTRLRHDTQDRRLMADRAYR